MALGIALLLLWPLLLAFAIYGFIDALLKARKEQEG